MVVCGFAGRSPIWSPVVPTLSVFLGKNDNPVFQLEKISAFHSWDPGSPPLKAKVSVSFSLCGDQIMRNPVPLSLRPQSGDRTLLLILLCVDIPVFFFFFLTPLRFMQPRHFLPVGIPLL